MLTCKEAAELISRSLDEKLPIWRRLSLWLHVTLCRFCRRYRRDLHQIHRAVGSAPDGELPADSGHHLSDEARDRIRQRLEADSPDEQ